MPGVKSLVKVSVINRTGMFPAMETQLSIVLRADRALGIPITLRMVRTVAEKLLLESNPDLFYVDKGKLVCKFKFSYGWLIKYMDRAGFSLRKHTNRSKLLLNPAFVNGQIGEFYVRMRVLQRSQKNDPMYGFASPTNIFNHDQMPVMFAQAGTRTVDEKGKDVIWVSAGQTKDEKRFATLDLYVPMEVLFDASGNPVNLPPPHLIFAATNVQSAEAFDPEEAMLYHPGVEVTFAPNAWVNEDVHSRGLQLCLAPQVERIRAANQKGIEIEDNLSSHKTSDILKMWSTEFKEMAHEFSPPNLTMDTQALDHHILIQYHDSIYEPF